MIQRPVPRALQYGIIQLMLFVMGIMLAIGAVHETGMVGHFARFCDATVHNVWIMGIATGAISCVLDTFATCMSFISIYPVVDADSLQNLADVTYSSSFMQNGIYWKIIAFCSAMGGNILPLGSISGLALMKMERIHIGWYFKNVGFIAMIGWLLGLIIMWAFN